MPTETAVVLHLAIGTVCVIFYWMTFFQKKGSPRHRRNGKVFLLSLLAVLVTVGGVLFLSGRTFAPERMVQFAYLTVCVVTVAGTAFLAIRMKHDLERFRGLWFKVLGILAFAMGTAVLAAGIATNDPMPTLFSVIGLLYGGAMIRFAYMNAPVHENWSLIWHLNGMTFLFNAVHGTLLAVLWRWLVDPSAGVELNLATQIGTMLGSLALRLWFGARYKAPLRLTARRSALAPA